MRNSVGYTLIFAAIICAVCAIMVSGSAVMLKERQEINAAISKQKKVLEVAGLAAAGESLTQAEVERLFENIEPVLIDLVSGEEVASEDPGAFDQQKAKKIPATSREAPDNRASVFRLPHQALIYRVLDEGGRVQKVVLPIEGYGLWGTLYGLIALSADTTTVEGLTYYEHKETPGLGGEVDNPRWKALWVGRQVFDAQWQPKIRVIKGRAGTAVETPYQVDGLSGATITSRGVTNMLDLWLGEHGFGPYLEKLRAGSV